MTDLRHTARRLGVCYLLFAIVIVLNVNLVFPDRFPVRCLPSIFLLFLVCCHMQYCERLIAETGPMKRLFTGITYMEILIVLIRMIKFRAFFGSETLTRLAWYAYYIPSIMFDTLFFYAALLIDCSERDKKYRKWRPVMIVSLLLSAVILTNDFHHLVFRFPENFDMWHGSADHGLTFWIINVWSYGLLAAAVVMLIRKTAVTGSRKNMFLFLLPASTGIIFLVLHLLGKTPEINGFSIVSYPETVCFMTAGMMECFMGFGMIPVNERYEKLTSVTSARIRIVDKAGRTVYGSDLFGIPSDGLTELKDKTLLDENTVFRKMILPGGYGFWLQDISEMTRLKTELDDINEQLSEEGELIRLRSELKEKQTAMAQRTALYVRIARAVAPQTDRILGLLEKADLGTDNGATGELLLLGVYIKRYANLMLIAGRENGIVAGELALAVAESVRYLNQAGIPSAFSGKDTDVLLDEDTALAMYAAFGEILEQGTDRIRGMMISLGTDNGKIIMKMTAEGIEAHLSAGMSERLRGCGIREKIIYEDDVSYLRLEAPVLPQPEGGDAQ